MITEIIVVVCMVLVLILLIKLVKNVLFIILNSVIGFFALIGLNVLTGINIPINFWSVIVVAIGGIIGLIVEIILHYTGIAF